MGEPKAWGAGQERGVWGRSSKVVKMGYFAHLCGSERPEELVPDLGAPPQLGTPPRHRPHRPHPALAHPERGQPARGAQRRGPFPKPFGDRPAPALPAMHAVSRHADSTPLGFFRSFASLPYCPTLCWLGTGTLRGLPLLGPQWPARGSPGAPPLTPGSTPGPFHPGVLAERGILPSPPVSQHSSKGVSRIYGDVPGPVVPPRCAHRAPVGSPRWGWGLVGWDSAPPGGPLCWRYPKPSPAARGPGVPHGAPLETQIRPWCRPPGGSAGGWGGTTAPRGALGGGGGVASTQG